MGSPASRNGLPSVPVQPPLPSALRGFSGEHGPGQTLSTSLTGFFPTPPARAPPAPTPIILFWALPRGPQFLSMPVPHLSPTLWPLPGLPQPCGRLLSASRPISTPSPRCCTAHCEIQASLFYTTLDRHLPGPSVSSVLSSDTKSLEAHLPDPVPLFVSPPGVRVAPDPLQPGLTHSWPPPWPSRLWP